VTWKVPAYPWDAFYYENGVFLGRLRVGMKMATLWWIFGALVGDGSGVVWREDAKRNGLKHGSRLTTLHT
jgi:hypothetical protein